MIETESLQEHHTGESYRYRKLHTEKTVIALLRKNCEGNNNAFLVTKRPYGQNLF